MEDLWQWVVEYSARQVSDLEEAATGTNLPALAGLDDEEQALVSAFYGSLHTLAETTHSLLLAFGDQLNQVSNEDHRVGLGGAVAGHILLGYNVGAEISAEYRVPPGEALKLALGRYKSLAKQLREEIEEQLDGLPTIYAAAASAIRWRVDCSGETGAGALLSGFDLPETLDPQLVELLETSEDTAQLVDKIGARRDEILLAFADLLDGFAPGFLEMSRSLYVEALLELEEDRLESIERRYKRYELALDVGPTALGTALDVMFKWPGLGALAATVLAASARKLYIESRLDRSREVKEQAYWILTPLVAKIWTIPFSAILLGMLMTTQVLLMESISVVEPDS
jgi:hypothetical protein